MTNKQPDSENTAWKPNEAYMDGPIKKKWAKKQAICPAKCGITMDVCRVSGDRCQFEKCFARVWME